MRIDMLLSAVRVALSGLTSSAARIGEVFDLGAARNHGLAAGPQNRAGWIVTITGGTSAGAATLSLDLITSDTEAMGTPTTLWSQSGIVLADTVKNQFFIPLENSDRFKRYIAFRANYGTAAFTGGTISVEFTADTRQWRAYPAETGR